MPQEDTPVEIQSLGTFLRAKRDQLGVSLGDVSETTKISLPVLSAMEENNYERMPAEAFRRGFYTLYATFLELDPKEILEQYDTERGGILSPSKRPPRPPIKKSKNFTNYAEPSSISPATSMTIFFTFILIISAALCWYFNWNPLGYLSGKLMEPQGQEELLLAPEPHPTGTEEAPTPVVPQRPVTQLARPTEETTPATIAEDTPAPGAKEDLAVVQADPDKTPLPHQAILQQSPPPEDKAPPTRTVLHLTEATSKIRPPGSTQQTDQLSPTATPYQLDFRFDNNGTLKVSLDDGFVLDRRYRAGETLRWEVNKNIILDMPQTISGTLHLNGITIPLPEPINGRRMLSLPEDLLN